LLHAKIHAIGRDLALRVVRCLIWKMGEVLVLQACATICKRLKRADAFQPVTDKVVEVRTPNSSTRFHAPNDRVELERELLEMSVHDLVTKIQKSIVFDPKFFGIWARYSRRTVVVLPL